MSIADTVVEFFDDSEEEELEIRFEIRLDGETVWAGTGADEPELVFQLGKYTRRSVCGPVQGRTASIHLDVQHQGSTVTWCWILESQ